MATASFVPAFDAGAGRPVLPDRDEPGDGQGLWPDDAPGYGYVTASYTPTDNTCIILVSSSQAVIDAMKASADFEWLEDA